MNNDSAVTTIDVIAIQRFFLAIPTGIADVGVHQFSPTSRNYPQIAGDQPLQNYDMLVFGDVASPFAGRMSAPVSSAQE